MKPLPAGQILTGVFAASLPPFLIVQIFHPWLYHLPDSMKYLVFHSITEFFGGMLSSSIFAVGWFPCGHSGDRQVHFLNAAFPAISIVTRHGGQVRADRGVCEGAKACGKAG
jgi:hypothetical protein